MRALNLLIEKRWTNLFRYLNAIQNAKLDDGTKMMSLQKLRRGSPGSWKLTSHYVKRILLLDLLTCVALPSANDNS